MTILGISCFYHDAAAALLKDGKLVAAAQEERFTRNKHDPSFPKNAIDYCLKHAKLEPKELDAVAFYDKPFLKFERILMTALENYPKGVFSFVPAMRTWMGQKLWIKQLILDSFPGFEGPLYFSEHHMSHAASAFLVSPFKKAAILTVDGVGEWATATRGFGDDLDITLTHEIHFPHSLGLLYSAFTYYLGFKVNSGEYKVMGLAPYGDPIYAKKITDNLIDIKKDGSFKLNLKYFAYSYAEVMTAQAFHRLFDGDPRPLGSKPTKREIDLAASLQRVTEEVMLRAANNLYQTYRTKNLCLAGGVALNCVANGKILKNTPFTDIFIQPAAGDAGGAVGAAAYVYHTLMRNQRSFDWKDTYLGPSYSNREIEKFLNGLGIKFLKLTRKNLTDRIVELILDQQVVGLFQGRMEFGPRALGNRSILADPRNPENKDRVNLKIKFRESFRPFAPSVLEEDAEDWFDLSVPSPYMLLVAQAKTVPSSYRGRRDKFSQASWTRPKAWQEEQMNTNNQNKSFEAKKISVAPSDNLQPNKFPSRGLHNHIPAVVHVDNSSRIHTVNKADNLLYWEILNAFKENTGVPILINTSFNQRGEPIVCTPKQALNCFLRTNMDYLVLGQFLVSKKEMPNSLIEKARKETFELD